MKHIQHSKFVLIALALTGLAACSTTAPQPSQPVVSAPQVMRITPFNQPEVDEAAGAYVGAYARTVASSLQAGKYIESLAFLHLNAESCLSSRASRLLGKELSVEDKSALLVAAVSPEQMRAYEKLSYGYKTRANGLEMFSCDHAGLKVASSAKY